MQVRDLDAWKESTRNVSRGSDGHRGRIRDMNLEFHLSIAINDKGGYFLLIRLVVIDVNP
jgi:hypothetical protein